MDCPECFDPDGEECDNGCGTYSCDVCGLEWYLDQQENPVPEHNPACVRETESDAEAEEIDQVFQAVLQPNDNNNDDGVMAMDMSE